MSRLELCHVCLRNGPEACLKQDPTLRFLFTDIIRLSDVPEHVFMCAWCAMSVHKAISVYENATRAAPVLRWLWTNIDNEVMVDNQIISLAQSQQKMLHSLVRTEIKVVEVVSEHEKTNLVDPLELTNEERNNVTGKTIKREFDKIDDCGMINVFEPNIYDGNPKLEKILQTRKRKNKKITQNGSESKSLKAVRKKKQSQEKKASKNIPTTHSNENNEDVYFQVVHLSNQEQLQEIVERRNSEKYLKSKLQCEACGLGFVGKDVYSKHMQRHDEAFGPYKCDICTLHFTTSEVLLQHRLAHRRYYRCRVCSAIVRRRCHCSEHRAKCTRTTGLTLWCEICSKMFKDPFSLKKHAWEVHLKAKQYECNYCSKNFGNKQKLVIHIRSHTGEKPYKCEICYKKFTTNSNMRAHLTVHRTEDKYYCVKCNIYCKTAKSLNRHCKSLIHQDGVFRYPCTDCQMQFASVTRLEVHIKNIHLGQRCYNCHICGKNYSKNSNLNKHIRTVHRTEECL